MKKMGCVVVMSVFVCGVVMQAFGGENNKGYLSCKDKEAYKTAMAEKEKASEKHKRQWAFCANKMRSTAMVTTADGSIVVMVGNTLKKYDKDLVLLKEVQITPQQQCICPVTGQACSMMKEKMKNETTPCMVQEEYRPAEESPSSDAQQAQ